MLKNKLLAILIAALLLPAFLFSQAKKATMAYISIPGPVTFDNTAYQLNWSSNPAQGLYKQEYLPAGQTAGHYKNMLLMDVVTGKQNAKDLAAQKVKELKQMKLSNPMINYNSYNNPSTGEFMIDFLVTANNTDGSISIIERNVYRYKNTVTASGEKAVLLFGISKRAYTKEADAFLDNFKATKSELVNKVAAFTLPSLAIKK